MYFMFVVSVPYGVCSIKLAKQPSTQKKEKKKHYKGPFTCKNFFYINLSHGGRKKNNK